MELFDTTDFLLSVILREEEVGENKTFMVKVVTQFPSAHCEFISSSECTVVKLELQTEVFFV